MELQVAKEEVTAQFNAFGLLDPAKLSEVSTHAASVLTHSCCPKPQQRRHERSDCWFTSRCRLLIAMRRLGQLLRQMAMPLIL